MRHIHALQQSSLPHTHYTQGEEGRICTGTTRQGFSTVFPGGNTGKDGRMRCAKLFVAIFLLMLLAACGVSAAPQGKGSAILT